MIDIDQLFAILKRRKKAELLEILDQAFDEMAPKTRRTVFLELIRKSRPAKFDGPSLLVDVVDFHRESLEGRGRKTSLHNALQVEETLRIARKRTKTNVKREIALAQGSLAAHGWAMGIDRAGTFGSNDRGKRPDGATERFGRDPSGKSRLNAESCPCPWFRSSSSKVSSRTPRSRR